MIICRRQGSFGVSFMWQRVARSRQGLTIRMCRWCIISLWLLKRIILVIKAIVQLVYRVNGLEDMDCSFCQCRFWADRHESMTVDFDLHCCPSRDGTLWPSNRPSFVLGYWPPSVDSGSRFASCRSSCARYLARSHLLSDEDGFDAMKDRSSRWIVKT